MERRSDAEVVADSLTRPDAFGALFDRHAATLLRYLARRVERPTAENLLGDLFRTAFELRARFDPARESPWLYGIATNLLRKHRRSEARRLRAAARAAASEASLAPRGSRDAGAGLDAGVLWPRLADAVDALPDAERDALLLSAWEGLAYRDFADALGVPVGTVRSRIHRARARLRERIGDPGQGDAGGREPTHARKPR